MKSVEIQRVYYASTQPMSKSNTWLVTHLVIWKFIAATPKKILSIGSKVFFFTYNGAVNWDSFSGIENFHKTEFFFSKIFADFAIFILLQK